MDNKKQTGFTIVELLIVIVVIGILAAITIVAYNGIQNRANDTAVQSDLRSIGGKFMEFKAINDTMPQGSADFTPMNLKVSKNAYGSHYTPAGSNGYNMIYCLNGNSIAIVAASKSGNVYVYKDGGVQVGVGPLTTFTTTCANNGVPSNGTWFFSNGTWQAWIS